jgi:methionyl aminopeptidase
MIGRNDLCWCNSGQKWKKCHFPQTSPQEAKKEDTAELYYKRYGIILKTPAQIEGIRRASKLSSDILTEVCKIAKAGVTTLELNDYAHKLCTEAGAIAASLGYASPPYPKSICTSINDVICHGIPDKTKLQDGDIVNVDIACILNGYFGDCSRMVEVGTVSPDKKLVCDVSYHCLMRSIEILKPGVAVSEIGKVIHDYADQYNCSVVTQFVGHGVGLHYHESPQIPHYRNSLGILLVPGMTFTIEPMINAGKKEAVIDKRDQWTARTVDGKPSAQWEHTVLITEDGHEILTTWTR